jgi:hypothetical protein
MKTYINQKLLITIKLTAKSENMLIAFDLNIKILLSHPTEFFIHILGQELS